MKKAAEAAFAESRPERLVQLLAQVLDAVGDQAGGALVVQAGGDQLLGGADGGVGGQGADLVQRGGFGLGDLVLGGGGAALDLGFQGGAAVRLRTGRLRRVAASTMLRASASAPAARF